ncbi:TPA: hypothetical protein DDZ86_03885 [Candidatus Dependentiae bacterium]|nr:MAG: Thioredoxin reductase [candidate division TM6 bacterium GW2011_GWF2_43_87]HBL98757.1 hypothetical protein [Candidatus Dependentiae bacterium]
MRHATRSRATFFFWLAVIVAIGYLGYRFYSQFKVRGEKAPIELSLNVLPGGALAGKEQIVPIAILGSGPAGLAAALYGARGGVHTVVFEGKQPGGQLMGTSWVENWPGMTKRMGPDLIKGAREQASEFGALFAQDTVVKVDFSTWPFVLETAAGLKIQALSVIVATGATPRRLSDEKQTIEGEDTYWGKGVSTCATCDAAFCKNADVVIVGGGDAAVEDALQLASYARTITLVVRGESMRASASMQERLGAYKNVTIAYRSKPVAIKGDGNHVTGVEIESGGERRLIPISYLFLAIGHTPNTAPFKGVLPMDERGHLTVVGHTQQTGVRGIFAAGDVADPHYKQAGVAAGDGIRAGLDALEFLREIGFNGLVAKQYESHFFTPEGGVNRKALMELKTAEDLDRAVASHKTVVLDFYTQYCPSCSQLLPVLELAAAQHEDIFFYKVDAAQAQAVVTRLGIESVPTVVVLKDGAVVGRMHESMSFKDFNDFLMSAQA